MKALRIVGAATLAVFVLVAWRTRDFSPPLVALQFTFTPASFDRIVAGWSADQLRRFREHLVLDYALLLGYGTFGWLLVTRTQVFAATTRALRGFARWMTSAAAACDALENVLEAMLVGSAQPGLGRAWLHALAGTISSTKWMLLLGFCAVTAAAWRGRRAHA